MFNKHGIPVVHVTNSRNTPKRKKRTPLNYELPRFIAEKVIDGFEVRIDVPKMSPVLAVMKEDGWRIKKEMSM